MSRPIVYVDTETTSLSPAVGEIWEIGLVYQPEPVQFPGQWQEFWAELPINPARANQDALDVGRWEERHCVPSEWLGFTDGPFGMLRESGQTSYARSVAAIAKRVGQILTGSCILAGAQPHFDAGFLGTWLHRHAIGISWYHRLLDVEAVAATAMGIPHPEDWGLSHLARTAGIDTDDYQLHTAIGDAWLAADLHAKAIALTAIGAHLREFSMPWITPAEAREAMADYL